MASQGIKRDPSEFEGMTYLTHNWKDDEGNKPLTHRITVEDGYVISWLSGRRHGKSIWYGEILKDLNPYR